MAQATPSQDFVTRHFYNLSKKAFIYCIHISHYRTFADQTRLCEGLVLHLRLMFSSVLSIYAELYV